MKTKNERRWQERRKKKITSKLEEFALLQPPFLPLKETLIFPEVGKLSWFFPLSRESLWRVIGERRKGQAERGGENHL